MFLSLRAKFLLVAGGVAIVTLGSALWALSYRLENQLTRQIADQLLRAESTFTEWQAESRKHLRAEARIVADDPRFFAAVVEDDAATTIPVAKQFQQLASSDLFLVCDRRGMPLAHLNANAEICAVEWPRTLPPVEEQIRYGDALYLLQSQAVTLGIDTIGYVALGRKVDAMLAESMGRVAGADVIFYGPDVVFGTTIPVSRQRHMIDALRDNEAAESAVPSETGEISFAGERYLLLSGLLQEQSNIRYGILISLDDRLHTRIAELRLTLLWVGTLALILAALISLPVARRMTNRVPKLVAAVEAVARGDYDQKVTHEGRDELQVVAEAVDRMRHELAAQMQAIRKANAEKIDAERLAVIGKMASSIIHDFKTPMQVVRSAIDLSVTAGLPAERREHYAAMVYRELDRMVGMTQDLLDFTRGETRMARSLTTLGEFLGEAIDAWQGITSEKNITIEYSEHAAAAVSIDRAKLRRALDNIVSNAIDVLADGGRIRIAASTRGDDVVLSIADTGPGIPAELRDRIFEPFATFGKANGTGLGLAVASKAVADHGGTIAVDSAPGMGTTFTITLPMAQAGAGDAVTAKEPIGVSSDA